MTSVDDRELHADLGWALGVVFRTHIKTANTFMADPMTSTGDAVDVLEAPDEPRRRRR